MLFGYDTWTQIITKKCPKITYETSELLAILLIIAYLGHNIYAYINDCPSRFSDLPPIFLRRTKPAQSEQHSEECCTLCALPMHPHITLLYCSLLS